MVTLSSPIVMGFPEFQSLSPAREAAHSAPLNFGVRVLAEPSRSKERLLPWRSVSVTPLRRPKTSTSH